MSYFDAALHENAQLRAGLAESLAIIATQAEELRSLRASFIPPEHEFPDALRLTNNEGKLVSVLLHRAPYYTNARQIFAGMEHHGAVKQDALLKVMICHARRKLKPASVRIERHRGFYFMDADSAARLHALINEQKAKAP